MAMTRVTEDQRTDPAVVKVLNRRRQRGWRPAALKLCAIWLGVVVASLFMHLLFGDQQAGSESPEKDSRVYRAQAGDLTSGSNCTIRRPVFKKNAIDEYPKDVFSEKQLKEGAVILHVIASVYMFLGTAIVCEDYFMPSLLIIADYLHLKPSVTGATLLAFGMSMPELVSSAIGVFVSKNDIGVGVMAGTAVANYVLIIGCCCLMKMKNQQVYLKAWPLTRDTVWYIISLVVLIIVMLNGRIDWNESACLLVVYVLYIFSMYFDDILQNTFERVMIRKNPETGQNRCCCFPMAGNGDETSDSPEAEEKILDGMDDETSEEQRADEEEPDSILTVPESTGSRVLWGLSLPLIVPMYLTVPDCRKKRWRKWFPLTFFMSMVWSTIFSYILIWMVTVIGFTMGVSDTLMGITLLGAGTSLPDLVACVIATRAGEGDMAVSASIGAITFDILLCLGLPWFIKTVFLDNFGVVFVQTAGLTLTLSTIFVTIAFVFIGICLSGWQFHRAFGITCLFVYVAFIVFAVFTEEHFAGTVAVFRDCDNPP